MRKNVIERCKRIIGELREFNRARDTPQKASNIESRLNYLEAVFLIELESGSHSQSNASHLQEYVQKKKH